MNAPDQPKQPPMLDLQDIGHVFRHQPDLVERMLNPIGIGQQGYAVHAIDGVTLDVHANEVVGLVGESGSGKSTLGRIASGLLPPTAGNVRFLDRDLYRAGDRTVKQDRLAIQMIFQDPYSSLNPRMRVKDIIGEAVLQKNIVPRGEYTDYIDRLMIRVGLDPSYKQRFPHQFSGGQRQRIGIARALAVKPRMLVCDEAVSALDVSVQAQVLNLFMEIKDKLGLTFLFISHDLGVVEHLCDRVAIMYLGRIVEQGPVDTIFNAPNHPYTQALLAAAPDIGRRGQTYTPIKGEIPSPLDPPKGCHFHPRCPKAMDECRVRQPAFAAVGDGHWSACHLNAADTGPAAPVQASREGTGP